MENATLDAGVMLEAIRKAQARFIADAAPRDLFEGLLEILLSLTESEYGFIGEVFHNADETPFLKTHAITNIAWNEATRVLASSNELEFRNLNSLFGTVLTSARPVIANDPANDPRAAGLPPGHPAMWSFMGLPILSNNKLVGMIGVANHPSGYTQELVDWLAPIIDTCATLIVAYQNVSARKRAEQSLLERNYSLQVLLHAIPDLMFELDGAGTYLNVWGAQGELLAAPEQQLLGRTVTEMLPAVAAAEVQAAMSDADAQGMSFGRIIMLPLPQGEHWFELSVSKKHGATDEAHSYIVLSRDVTSHKMAEDELRIAAATFNTQEAILITDHDAKIVRVNRSFEEITGYSAEEMVGQNPSILQSGRHEADFYQAMWSTLLASGKWSGEVWDRRKNGEIYPKYMTITAIYADNQTISNYVAVFTDISQRKQSEHEIHQLAFFDPLTQLPNRRLLQDRLQQAMASSVRSGRRGALIFLDLDHFKVINDTQGHATGDLLLIEVARRLQRCVREGDSVARLSGDEFVVVLENLSREKDAAATQAELVAEKIRDELNQTFILKNYECQAAASIGISLFLGHQESMEELFKHADVAMYQAKSAGRNAISFFDPQMQISLELRTALEVDLRQALSRQQFTLHYQIQVDSQHRVMGAEVLLRWHHPQRGFVFPDQFIPLAEESGLIVPIGLWVLQTACRQLKIWQGDPLFSQLTLSVNVSARQFRQAGFEKLVQRVLDESGANPQLLKLELTESLVLENVEETIEKMQTLKLIGVGFSMDDFGTGHSSLSYLKRLPLDQIKIDQSFVRDITSDPDDASIVKAIIAMSEALDLDVIAEGVETEAQSEFLALHGCHAFQGYLFSRPIPLEQFEEKLNNSDLDSQ
jgi:diguanylate cyclase (GGDEF)-like protein/PAS domain S-box-containing protein